MVPRRSPRTRPRAADCDVDAWDSRKFAWDEKPSWINRLFSDDYTVELVKQFVGGLQMFDCCRELCMDLAIASKKSRACDCRRGRWVSIANLVCLGV